MPEKSSPKVIANKSKAYGYNYTSLGDIALAGFEIPKMRTTVFGENEYIEYLDSSGSWQQGAKVVIPEMKGSNEAQKYGAALSYARRYTALLALQLSCEDDKKIEEAQFNPDQVLKDISKANSAKELKDLYERVPEKFRKQLTPNFTKRKLELGES